MQPSYLLTTVVVASIDNIFIDGDLGLLSWSLVGLLSSGVVVL